MVVHDLHAPKELATLIMRVAKYLVSARQIKQWLFLSLYFSVQVGPCVSINIQIKIE